MIKKLLALVAMMGLSATTGCMAPVESDEISDEATEEEAVGEAEEALWRTVTLGCSLNFSQPFIPVATITNNSSYNVPDVAVITVKVYHFDGYPITTDTTFGPLDRFDSMTFTPDDQYGLWADYCTASAKWNLDDI